jgi:hypothetical protein
MNAVTDPRFVLKSSVTGVASYRDMRAALDPHRKPPVYRFDAPAWDKALRAVKAHAFALNRQWAITVGDFIHVRVPAKWRTFKTGHCRKVCRAEVKLPAPHYWPGGCLPDGLKVVV